MTSRLRAALLTAALALGGLAACAPGEQPAASDNAGYRSGDGTLTQWDDGARTEPIEAAGTTFEGEDLALAELRGDVVVVNFWYAACPPCRAEAGDLAEISEEYADQGVQFVGVNPRDDVPTAQAFERNFAVPYPSLHDDDAQVVASFEGIVPLQAMPTTVVIDQEGRPAARILGQIDPSTLRGLLDDTLAEAA